MLLMLLAGCPLCWLLQVAGYAVEFEPGLTFATVKGAGHMIPQTKPQASLAVLQLWMQQQL